MVILSITISFIAVAVSSFTLGFYSGKNDIKLPTIKRKDTIKILTKSEPKTYEQKRTEALDENRDITKTFSK